MHSVLYEAIFATIQGRSNNFSVESLTQQAIIIQDWSDVMQVINGWRTTRRKIVNSVNVRPGKIIDNKTNYLNANTKSLMSVISTSCRAMGHFEEAAKYARRCCFALLDNFGLNSVFLTTTPDDECSFRVKLYSKPEIWVSQFVTSLNSCFEKKTPVTHSLTSM